MFGNLFYIYLKNLSTIYNQYGYVYGLDKNITLQPTIYINIYTLKLVTVHD